MSDTSDSLIERAVLVHVVSPQHHTSPQELAELVVSAGVDIAATLTTTRDTPEPKFFIGSGKVEELKALIESSGANLVIFNHTLSPAQERNVERAVCCRVLGRSGLILAIFAKRARTFEGKLQVELAQLRYLSTRLVRGWTHLERQKGGIGLRGPGETQLETDRRLIRGRIKNLLARLEKVQQQRALGRRARKRAALPTISLVGYTNAGKSTLFNRLTGASVLAADQLFATLDPTMRRLDLAGGHSVILADTVGFISDLPPALIAAFRATLEETQQASLLLHVIDRSDAHYTDKMAEVDTVLTEIEAGKVPRLEIYNKIDCCEGFTPRLERDAAEQPVRVWMSAQAGLGFEHLLTAIGERLFGRLDCRQVCLAPTRAALRAQLYQRRAVVAEENDEAGNWLLSVRLSADEFPSLFAPDELRE